MDAPPRPEVLDRPQQSGGGLAKLTAEQLLEYVKKQNIKLKKMKLENDTLQKNVLELKANNAELKSLVDEKTISTTGQSFQPEVGSSYNLFWDLIDRRPEWQQTFARIALQSLCQGLSKLSPTVGSSSPLRRAFNKWVTNSNSMQVAGLQTALMEARKVNTQLEQRVAKLKSLLARMHQSSQRSQEDTVSARKGQLEATQELRLRVDKEEAENRALAEQLRCLSFESAFQMDIELAIEKAAQSIAAQTASASHSSSESQLQAARLQEQQLQMTVAELQKRLDLAGQELLGLTATVTEQTELLNTKDKTIAALEESERVSRSCEESLKRDLADERATLSDVELELQILLSQREELVAGAERAADEKHTETMQKLEISYREAQSELETMERRALGAEAREDRVQKDLATARRRLAAQNKIQSENERLHSVIRELKRSGSTSVGTSGEDVSRDGQEDEGVRVLRKLWTERGVVAVEKGVLEYLLGGSEGVLGRLVSATLHQRQLRDRLDMCLRDTLPHLTALTDMAIAMATHGCSLLQSVMAATVTQSVRWIDTMVGLDLITVEDLDTPDGPSSTCVHPMLNSADACYVTTCLAHDMPTFDDLFLSRMADIETKAAAVGSAKCLLRVYHRVLKKTRHLMDQLEEFPANGVACEHAGEPSPASVLVSSTPEDDAGALGLSVAIVPHHLDYEATDISLATGDDIRLPMPMPSLPPSDGSLPMELSKEVRLSWALRGSKGTLTALRMSLSPLAGTTSAGDFVSIEHSDTIPWSTYVSTIQSSAGFSEHQLDFCHKHTAEDSSSYVSFGHHILQTSAGDQLLCIHNSAMWSTAVICYSIHLENISSDTSRPSIDQTNKPTPQKLLPSIAVTEIPTEDTQWSAAAHRTRIEERIAALSAPLEMLREGLRSGAHLRQRLQTQWMSWEELQATVGQVNSRLKHEQERLLRKPFSDCVESGDREHELKSQFQNSQWSRDLLTIRKVILQLEQGDAEISDNVLSRQLLGIWRDGYSSDLLVVGPGSSSPQSPISVEVATKPSPVSIPTRSLGELPGRVVFSSARLKVMPGSDFRCPLRMEHQRGSYVLSWDFTLLSGHSASEVQSREPEQGQHSERKVDIGFSVLGKTAEGCLPLLVPYSRAGPEGSTHVGSVRLRVVEMVNGEDWLGPRTLQGERGEEMQLPFRDLIVLFDNTYSWFRPKFVRYDISLDFQPDEGDVARPRPVDGIESCDCDRTMGGVVEGATDTTPAVVGDGREVGTEVGPPDVFQECEAIGDLACLTRLYTTLTPSAFLSDSERGAATERVHSLSASVSALAQDLLQTVEDVREYNRDVTPLIFK